jgi:murein DD-endopeptidase MepM/ murein hydrolase activator NlpD
VAFAGTFSTGQSAAWWRRGNLVVLRHGDAFVSILGHCETVKVRRGDRVIRGQPVATVGSSGFSSGPHLYYELRKRGADGQLRPVDPVLYIFDRPWPNEARLVEGWKNSPPPESFDPLPAGLGL